jgi:hypothetical protein
MLRPHGDLIVSDWEPHDRPSLPEYNFVVQATTRSGELARTLSAAGVSCAVTQRAAVARAFALDVAEAGRRATVFFPEVEEVALNEAVTRKVHLMRRALPADVSCRRYLLRATLPGAPE